MRTNVVIDETFMADAIKYTGLPTKKAVIEEALRTLVRLKSQERIRGLRGRLRWQGDLDAMRAGRYDGELKPNSAESEHVDR